MFCIWLDALVAPTYVRFFGLGTDRYYASNHQIYWESQCNKTAVGSWWHIFWCHIKIYGHEICFVECWHLIWIFIMTNIMHMHIKWNCLSKLSQIQSTVFTMFTVKRKSKRNENETHSQIVPFNLVLNFSTAKHKNISKVLVSMEMKVEKINIWHFCLSYFSFAFVRFFKYSYCCVYSKA